MNKENFIEYIKLLQQIEKRQTGLIGSGIELVDYNENFFVAMDYLMKALFQSYEIDLINDFIWTQKKITIRDAKTNKVICVIKSPETLWSYLESAKK